MSQLVTCTRKSVPIFDDERRYTIDAFFDMFARGLEQLLGRASGPLHLRLIIMPIVVTTIAIRAGLKDAREREPAFLWGIITARAGWKKRLILAWKDIARIFLIAIVIDVVYQAVVFWAFYPVQTLIVTVICAIVPYILVRGPTTLLTRNYFRYEQIAKHRMEQQSNTANSCK